MPTRPPVHQPPWAKPVSVRKRERERAADAARPSSPRRGYDRAWRGLRAAYLAANPTCKVIDCGAPAIEVHHLKDVRHHPHLRLEWSNLRGLCHTCHSRITAMTQGFARKRAPGPSGAP